MKTTLKILLLVLFICAMFVTARAQKDVDCEIEKACEQMRDGWPFGTNVH